MFLITAKYDMRENKFSHTNCTYYLDNLTAGCFFIWSTCNNKEK